MRRRRPSSPNQRSRTHSFSARKRRPSWGVYSLMSGVGVARSSVRRYSGTRLKAARSSGIRRLRSSEASNGVYSHLCGLTTIESARSQPSKSARRSGRSATTPAYAASTWSQRPWASATRAISPIGSAEVDAVVPIVATMAIGRSPAARSASIADSSASMRIRYASSVSTWTIASRPRPRVMHALSMELWASAEAYTRGWPTSGRFASPCRAASRPAASRAAARPMSEPMEAVSVTRP